MFAAPFAAVATLAASTTRLGERPHPLAEAASRIPCSGPAARAASRLLARCRGDAHAPERTNHVDEGHLVPSSDGSGGRRAARVCDGSVRRG